jgi:DNA polymerase III alpha subunit
MAFGILATNAVGYTNLVGLSTLAHKNYKYKPLIDFGDMAQLAEAGLLDGLAVMTGCWFGLMPTLLREHDWRSSVKRRQSPRLLVRVRVLRGNPKPPGVRGCAKR